MSTGPDNGIRQSASRLRGAVIGAMAFIGLGCIAAQFDLQFAHAHFEYRLHGTPFEGWIAAGSIALLLMALLRLTQMLGLMAGGELFTVGVVRRFRAFALWLLLMALFEFASPVVVSLVAPSVAPAHQVRVHVDLRDVLTVGITLLLFLLARLLEQARRLDEEMREFV